MPGARLTVSILTSSGRGISTIGVCAGVVCAGAIPMPATRVNANSPNFLFTSISPLLRARAPLHQSPHVGDVFVFGVGRAERHAHGPPF